MVYKKSCLTNAHQNNLPLIYIIIIGESQCQVLIQSEFHEYIDTRAGQVDHSIASNTS